jgi:uncharacterized lipoprotein YehR (DUF1307 family)
MKKIIALVLVLVMALVVFSSCAKKEEAKEETAKMSITIINKTGETAKDITLKEQKASKPQSWGQGELANDQEITITVNTVVENNAPFINFSYALENGNNIQTSIMTKGDKVITLTLGEDGSPLADIAEK